MSQRKMLGLSTGALLLLLPWFVGPVLRKISNNFLQHLGFFCDKTQPQGISTTGQQPVCQHYNNCSHFASLYHHQHHLPLYSAHILSAPDGKQPSSIWMYEPQVSRKIVCSSQEQQFPFKADRCFFYYLVHPIYIIESRLNNRNTSLYKVKQFISSTNCSFNKLNIYCRSALGFIVWGSIYQINWKINAEALKQNSVVFILQELHFLSLASVFLSRYHCS